LTDQLDEILKNVNCIHGLGLDHVYEIQALAQTIEITKFKVSETEFSDWFEKIGTNIRVEYDMGLHHVIFKGPVGSLHERASHIIQNWTEEILGRALAKVTGRTFTSFDRAGKVIFFYLERVTCMLIYFHRILSNW
jgi:hypothetical protein